MKNDKLMDFDDNETADDLLIKGLTPEQLDEEFKLISDKGLLKRIHNDLQSENPDDCAYAIRSCCIQHISNDEIVKRLRELKHSDKIAMYQKLSKIATAALDILGAEKYTGDDGVIKDIIDTVYYSK